MVDFDGFFDGIKNGIIDLAKGEADEFLEEAKADADSFLDSAKDDIKTWTKQLVDGELSEREYKFLLGTKRDVLELKALADKGLAKVRIENIVNGALDMIKDAATQLI